jgi:hypothetical protein
MMLTVSAFSRRETVRAGWIAAPALDLTVHKGIDLAGVADQRVSRGEVGDQLVSVVRLLEGLVDDLQKMLAADLDGYAAYMRTVRYRLVPGIW